MSCGDKAIRFQNAGLPGWVRVAIGNSTKQHRSFAELPFVAFLFGKRAAQFIQCLAVRIDQQHLLGNGFQLFVTYAPPHKRENFTWIHGLGLTGLHGTALSLGGF